MCFVRRRNSAKVESCSWLGYFTFIILAAAIVGGAALPGKRPAEHRSANACIASHQIVGSMHGPSSCAARSLQPSERQRKRRRSRKLKDILAQDERVVKIDKNWDGRPSRRFIQPKTNVSLHRRPLPKENQKTPAFGRGTRRPPGRTVPPAGSTSEETG